MSGLEFCFGRRDGGLGGSLDSGCLQQGSMSGRDGLGRNMGLGGGLLEGAGVDFVGLREGAGADLVRRGLGVELGLLGGANPPGGVDVLGLDPGLLGAK